MAFPTSPVVNQYYTSTNGTIYLFDGVGWAIDIPDFVVDGTNGSIDIGYGDGTSPVTYPVLSLDETTAPAVGHTVTFDGNNYAPTSPDNFMSSVSADAISPTQLDFSTISVTDADAVIAASNGVAAADTSIVDAGGIITATNVEDALAEIATELDNLALLTNGNGASLVGVEDAAGNFTATTVEGVLAELGAASSGATNLDELTDVDTTTTAPVAGDLLRFDGSNFVPISLIVESATEPTGAASFPGVIWNDTTNDLIRIRIDNGGNPIWVNLT